MPESTAIPPRTSGLETKFAITADKSLESKRSSESSEPINPRMSAGGLLLACEAGLNIPELMLMDYLNMPLPEIQPPSRPIKMLRYLDEIFIR